MAALESFDIERLRVPRVEPLADDELPRVVVAMATLDGLDRLRHSLPALAASNYPRERLGVALTDNGSQDGTLEWLAREHPHVRVVRNTTNEGFAGPSNRAAELGKHFGGQLGEEPAEVIVFLNNDVEIEADFLRELVAPIVRGSAVCTGAKLLSWDRQKIDHAGGGVNFQGIAIAYGWQQAPDPRFDWPRRCLFACGGAMAISAAALDVVGGFDEAFFAYYEDSDLGWRLWLAGHEVHYVPSAIGRHRHSGTSTLFPRETLRLVQVRNPLLSCVKNYDAPNFQRILPALLALAVRRMWVLSQAPDARPYRMELAKPHRGGLLGQLGARLRRRLERPLGLPRLGAADFFAINDLLGDWGHWMARREQIQALRKRPDSEIFELFLKPLWCVESEPGYVQLQAGICEQYGLDELFGPYSIADFHPEG